MLGEKYLKFGFLNYLSPLFTQEIEEEKKEKNKIYPNGEISDEMYDLVYG